MTEEEFRTGKPGMIKAPLPAGVTDTPQTRENAQAHIEGREPLDLGNFPTIENSFAPSHEVAKAIMADPCHAEPGCGELLAHFKRMQAMAGAYLEPVAYIDRTGATFISLGGRKDAFIGDMLYMLDGPEQRAIESDLTNGGYEGDYIEALRKRHPEAFEQMIAGFIEESRSADHPNAI